MRKRGRFEAPPVARSARKKTNIHLQMMVSSAVSMVLCCSMLLGTTMAWFTDTITSAANQILIGELKVDVLYNGSSLKDTSTPIFGGSGDTVWSPGDVRVRELTVKNEGSLGVKYSLNFLTTETEQAAYKYFDVYVKEIGAGDIDLTQENDDSNSNLTLEGITDSANGWKHVGQLDKILTDKSSVFSGSLEPVGSTTGITTQSYAIALCMDENVTDSSIQGNKLMLNIQLHAYQSNASEDDVALVSDLEESTEDTDSSSNDTDSSEDTNTSTNDTNSPSEDTNTSSDDTNSPSEDTNTPSNDINSSSEDTNASTEDTSSSSDDTNSSTSDDGSEEDPSADQ